jgi:hypothetical protein
MSLGIHDRGSPMPGTLRSALWVGIGLLSLVTHQLASQSPSFAPGMRLRVTRPESPPVVGTAVRWSGDSLWMALPGLALPTAVSFQGSKFEVSRGMRSRVVPGAVIGLAVGAVVTTVFLTQFCGGDTLCDGDEQVRAAVIFGLPSVALGAGIGFLIRRESWERLDPSTIQGAGAGRIMLGVTLHW